MKASELRRGDLICRIDNRGTHLEVVEVHNGNPVMIRAVNARFEEVRRFIPEDAEITLSVPCTCEGWRTTRWRSGTCKRHPDPNDPYGPLFTPVTTERL